MLDFLKQYMGGVMPPGTLPPSLEQFQGGQPNLFPGYQGINGPQRAMGGGLLPNVINPPNAVTMPYGLQAGPMGPGMSPAEMMSMGGMPSGMHPSLGLALMGLAARGDDEEPMLPPAPGGGIHRMQPSPMPQFGPTGGLLRR